MSERDLDLLESLWTLPTADPGPRALTPRADHGARGQVERHTGRPLSVPGAVPAGAPVLTGLQRQGDLLVVPLDLFPADTRTRLDRLPTLAQVALTGTPVTVLASEHVHQLTGRDATWAPFPLGDPARVVVGVLTVGAGDLEETGPLERTGGLEPVAVLSHTGHHGALAVGPGRYLLRRQRAATPRPRPTTAAHPATQPARRPATWHPHQD